ncbi:gastrula zinc finger protein XlCGF57.1-like [Condylostylus longicornis]|uniref:gastrula zinc finger protein XlCGF57.1-like n=1 Tax=Condylostylus longicornis TaxID=2530218 RepID=UPI00244E0418|nr:gastrula zinc finger protein XlCGF57.1-like [Condylostylus longicornis]
MALSHSKIDKLLQLFSSSEDEELDKASDNEELDLKPCIFPVDIPEKNKKTQILKKKEIEKLPQSKSKNSDDEIKVVELEVKPIEINDSENDTKSNFSENRDDFENSDQDDENLNEKKKAKRNVKQKKTLKKENCSDSENDFIEVKRKGRRKHDPVGNKRGRTRKNRPKVGRNIKCKQCDMRMKNEQLFMFHMQIHEGRKETECTLCNEDFETIPNLQDHYAQFDKTKMDDHYIKLRPFCCHLCDLRYKSRNYLLDHLDIHAGDKKFLCPICGKQFFKRFSLKVHLRYHQKSYHSCERCKLDLQFRNPKEYIAHLRIVHGENAFRCPICDREFSRKHDMMKHKDTHSREPNCCTQCNINFGFRREFNQHMKEVHNRIKKFTCNICGKIFLMHCKLTRHLETHNKIRENCNLCGKEFRSRRDYNAHMRNMHGVVLDLPKTESKKSVPRQKKGKIPVDNDAKPLNEEIKDDDKFDLKIDMKAQDFSGYLLKNKNNF